MRIGTTFPRAIATAFLSFMFGTIALLLTWLECWLYLNAIELIWLLPTFLFVIGAIIIPTLWSHYTQPKWKQDVAGAIMTIWVFGIISGIGYGLIASQQMRQGIFWAFLFLGTICLIGFAFEWSIKTLKGKSESENSS